MATEIKLPRLGQGMESGTIVRWLKSEGEEVAKGEPLYELDTDKVTQEVEADAGGVLLKILVGEGAEDVEVGRTIALVGEAGEDVQVEAPTEREPEAEEKTEAKKESAEPKEEKKEPAEPKEEPMPERAATNGDGRTDGRVKASPLARRIARERGIDIGQLRGTGPEGRIVAEDVERAERAPAAPAAAPAEGVEREPLTQLRKTIARRMSEAWQAPAFQISMSADMERALALRRKLVERYPEERPTVTDLLVKVCALALMRHRAVNALFAGDAVELYPTANVGIAVAIPKGLVVPVIQSCERKSVAEIARERADLVGRARDGKLQQSDLEGGTFTVSNLGMYGVEQFVAVLNPPQAAILAVGATEERAVVRDGEIVARPLMTLTLTCDHRSIDGATAADFLRTVKEFLEEPGLAL
jgi:pyruvate dehydrogenase E2 component (dihydrolipoamide acetyltransferase)